MELGLAWSRFRLAALDGRLSLRVAVLTCRCRVHESHMSQHSKAAPHSGPVARSCKQSQLWLAAP